MALLTEHDVLHKKFQAAKFRQEGYNQDEVDDFLDEVADTIRLLTVENESLKNGAPATVAPVADPQIQAEVESLRAANEELKQQLSAASAASQGDHNALHEEAERLRGRVHELEGQLAQANEAVSAARAEAERVRMESTSAPVEADSTGAEKTATGMLALAQRLHDEYVQKGKDESDRIVSEAKNNGENIVREAEENRSRILAQLEDEKTKLESVIGELREFESDYRGRLTEYLQGLLANIGNTTQN